MLTASLSSEQPDLRSTTTSMAKHNVGSLSLDSSVYQNNYNLDVDGPTDEKQDRVVDWREE